MFQKCTLLFAAVFLFSLGICSSARAQLYYAPDVSNVTNRIYAPSVSRVTSDQRNQTLNSGFSGSGIRSPLPFMQSTGGARIGLGVNTSSRGSKPFSSYTSAPTVSPYLNLFRTDLNGGGNFNYSTLVQPQLQQQQVNQQLERQAIQSNRRLTSIAAQSAFNPQGSKDEYPTGHQTVFNYMGHYYQAPHLQQKKRQ